MCNSRSRVKLFKLHLLLWARQDSTRCKPIGRGRVSTETSSSEREDLAEHHTPHSFLSLAANLGYVRRRSSISPKLDGNPVRDRDDQPWFGSSHAPKNAGLHHRCFDHVKSTVTEWIVAARSSSGYFAIRRRDDCAQKLVR